MKLFKRKQQAEIPNDEWWKDPRLDDEGTYDYLVEELPQDSAKWEQYYTKCDSCGKYHSINFCSTHYFYCWDGWDSMSYTECWKCMLKDNMCSIKSKFIRKIKLFQTYNESIRMFKTAGAPITKEVKNTAMKIAKEVAR